jgi:hypothetical protein
MIRYGCILLGIEGDRLPIPASMLILCENLKSHNGNLRYKELKLAFEMAASLKLDFSPNPYQSMNVLYLNELLNAYKKWSATAYKILKPESNYENEVEKSDWSPRIYERLSEDKLRADIQDGYHNYRMGIITQPMYIPYDWWAQLVTDRLIEYDDNATVYENVQVSKLDADQKRKLKNGQQMVWLLFNLAHQQGRENLYIADSN